MELTIIIEVIFIFIIIISAIVGIINNLKFMQYLKRNRPQILDNLINKHSLIKLPYYMNIKPREFISYCIHINKKEDDKRIIFHKITYLVSISSFLISFLISFLL